MLRSRLDDIPIYSRAPAWIPAARYNRVRLALRRIASPLRVELPGLKHLDLILEDNVWAVVDRVLNDVPVVAWTEFAHRDDLHTPINCELRYYHAHAELVANRALELCDRLLEERLHPKT